MINLISRKKLIIRYRDEHQNWIQLNYKTIAEAEKAYTKLIEDGCEVAYLMYKIKPGLHFLNGQSSEDVFNDLLGAIEID